MTESRGRKQWERKGKKRKSRGSEVKRGRERRERGEETWREGWEGGGRNTENQCGDFTCVRWGGGMTQ